MWVHNSSLLQEQEHFAFVFGLLPCNFFTWLNIVAPVALLLYCPHRACLFVMCMQQGNSSLDVLSSS